MIVNHNDHHLLLGELTDFLSGEVMADTHDERYRQKIARFLVDSRGYHKSQIQKSVDQIIHAGSKTARMKIDFLVSVQNRIGMIIKYNPGSIVTRRQSGIALSRIVAPYQIPVVVITNGETAEIVEGATGNVTGSAFDALPSRNELEVLVSTHIFEPVPEKIKDMASRIVHAFEIDDACPCDSDICRME